MHKFVCFAQLSEQIFDSGTGKMEKHPAAARMITALGCFPAARLGCGKGDVYGTGMGLPVRGAYLT